MSKTEVISTSLRTELHPAQSANSQPKPNDGFVDVHALQSRRIPFGAAPFARLAGVAGGRQIQARGRVPRAAATGTRSRTLATVLLTYRVGSQRRGAAM
jgi:hypothetical protein